MPKSHATSASPVREDIQGLRVVGALLIFAFHVFFTGVSGGVDVFFVVSGYFMARTAIGRPPPDSAAAIIAYYRDFLTRIAPQAIAAIIGIVVLMFALASPLTWSTNLRDISASALYLENWWLAWRGQDYLARSESLSLAQHFWAVSLIGQSYLLWPLILAFAGYAAGKSNAEPRALLFSLTLSLSALSFCWSLYHTHHSPASAYFDFFSRFWEFGCGALLGLRGLEEGVESRRRAAVLSWVGLALFASCGLFIGSRLDFPGYAALWPVAAAILIIRYGRQSDSFNAGRLLAARPIPALGSITFGFYLWHWPIYAIYADHSQGASATLLAGAAILLAAAALALLSRGFVESLLGFSRRWFGMGAIASVSLCILVAISISCEAARRYISENGAEWDRQNLLSDPGFIAPGPFTARGDLAVAYRMGCHQSDKSDEPKTCEFGSDGASRTLVIVGGSHSVQWLPALILHAKEENWKVVSMTKAACIFGDPEDRAIFEGFDPSCAEWNLKAIDAIAEMDPDLVVTIATRWVDRQPPRSEYVPQGYVSWFERLGTKGIKVMAIRDNPWIGRDVPSCVYSPVVSDKNSCGIARSDVLDDRAFAEARKRLPANVHTLDLTDEFCDEERCWAIKDKILIYRDDNHVTITYVEHISARVAEAVGRILE